MSTRPSDGPSKTDMLQALLDTQKVAGDLFDAVDADTYRLDLETIQRVGDLASRLDALHRGMTYAYVLSGRAGRDLLNTLRETLSKETASGSDDPL